MNIITDTRALLRLFRQSGYRDVYLRFGDYELFVARPGGGADPLRAAPAAPSADSVDQTAPAASESMIVAPHIASFVSALPVGSTVAAGDAVARIEVLGEPIDLHAGQAGMVADVLVQPGALLEYDVPLVRLLAA